MSEHRVLFDDDPEIGRKVWLIFDEAGRIKGAHVEQQADKILEQNAQTRSFNDGQKWGDYKPAASIPLTMYEKLGVGEAMRQKDFNYVRRIINDSDHEKFRTSDGSL